MQKNKENKLSVPIFIISCCNKPQMLAASFYKSYPESDVDLAALLYGSPPSSNSGIQDLSILCFHQLRASPIASWLGVEGVAHLRLNHPPSKMTALPLTFHWPEIVTWPTQMQRRLGSVEENMSISSTSKLWQSGQFTPPDCFLQQESHLMHVSTFKKTKMIRRSNFITSS